MDSQSLATTANVLSPKSFWQKKEGTPGKWLMGIFAAGGVYALYLTLPFLLSVVWGVVNLLIGLAVVGAISYVVLNKTVQNLAGNIFQSICRGIARGYTEIDPIGILDNNLDDMRKAKKTLDGTVQRFAGSDNTLKASIARKTAEITQLANQSNAAQRILATKTDQIERDRISMQMETYQQKAGMLMQGVQQLQALENQTSDMLTKFRRWSQVSDAKIERTQMRRDFYAEQYKSIMDAKATLGVGMRLLEGDSEEVKLVNMDIEYLQADAAQTLGEIQEFNRFSDKMLTDIDIENSANAELARQKFAEFGVKLDDASNKPVDDHLKLPGKAVVPALTATASSGYSDLFKK